jgi:hypothetical protein
LYRLTFTLPSGVSLPEQEELTLVQMDRHATELEELDVEGILAFAERVLQRVEPVGAVVAQSKAAAAAALFC